MPLWSNIITIAIFIASLCIATPSSLSASTRRLLGRSSRRRRRRERRERRKERREKRREERRKRRKKRKNKSRKFSGCSDTFDDGRKFSDDFNKATDFILENWGNFEEFVKKEADIKIKRCLKRRLEKSKISCIAPDRKWPFNCDGNWCGKASPFSSSIKICEASFLNELKDDSQEKRLPCIATLMVHEFAHTCWRSRKSVDKLDEATLKWYQQKNPSSASFTCPCITPGQDAFPSLQFYPEHDIDEPVHFVDTSSHLFEYSAAIIFVFGILICSGTVSMLCGFIVSLITRIRNMANYSKNQSNDYQRAIE